MKICTKCHTEKLLTEFNKRKQSKDGYNSHCKICAYSYTKKSYSDYNQIYSLINKENKKNYNKKWVENNKEKDRLRKNNYVKNRIKFDELYRCRLNTRKLLSASFKRNNFNKNSKTENCVNIYDNYKCLDFP